MLGFEAAPQDGFPAGLLPHIFFHPDYTVGYGIVITAVVTKRIPCISG